MNKNWRTILRQRDKTVIIMSNEDEITKTSLKLKFEIKGIYIADEEAQNEEMKELNY